MYNFKPVADDKPYPESLKNSLAKGYGDNLLILMARDPYWAFGYWEVSEYRKNDIMDSIGIEKFLSSRLFIRIYKIEKDNETLHLETDLGIADSWHMNLNSPGREFYGVLGYLTCDNQFIQVARSNNITMPRDTFSDIFDEEWMVIEESYGRAEFSLKNVSSSPHIYEDLRKSVSLKIELGITSTPKIDKKYKK
jgi:hypothetical protein